MHLTGNQLVASLAILVAGAVGAAAIHADPLMFTLSGAACALVPALASVRGKSPEGK